MLVVRYLALLATITLLVAVSRSASGIRAASRSAIAPRSESRPAVITDVPFAYVRHEIIVSVFVNGSGPYSMLFDTDTAPFAIDNRLARRLKLRPSGAAGQGEGVGSGSNRVVPFELSSVALGEVRASRIAALSADLAPLSHAFGHRIDGVVGRSFLLSRIVTVDYPRHELRFLRTAPRGRPTAPITYPSELSVRDVSVGGRPTSATIDTGNGGFLAVSYDGVRALGLAGLAARSKAATAHGYNGATPVRDASLPDLQIGQSRFGRLPAKLFVLASRDDVGPYLNIGNRVLDRYVVTFDFRDYSVTFEK